MTRPRNHLNPIMIANDNNHAVYIQGREDSLELRDDKHRIVIQRVQRESIYPKLCEELANLFIDKPDDVEILQAHRLVPITVSESQIGDNTQTNNSAVPEYQAAPVPEPSELFLDAQGGNNIHSSHPMALEYQIAFPQGPMLSGSQGDYARVAVAHPADTKLR